MKRRTKKTVTYNSFLHVGQNMICVTTSFLLLIIIPSVLAHLAPSFTYFCFLEASEIIDGITISSFSAWLSILLYVQLAGNPPGLRPGFPEPASPEPTLLLFDSSFPYLFSSPSLILSSLPSFLRAHLFFTFSPLNFLSSSLLLSSLPPLFLSSSPL